jgi:hypothetical protein
MFYSSSNVSTTLACANKKKQHCVMLTKHAPHLRGRFSSGNVTWYNRDYNNN